ncbi:hypothetical protein [Enterococcus pallens]|uniref:Uncharacterized protein n=1 Tax=Enterococcus pallens ATCC BAA-351 TaxID=1158607 RepID=R2SDU0_9ENTE|nr:hypothetical protein [Enterococcus pallens]EOH93695.1 hypothetical protein UAU_02391 [Enterococcus pallens ATCC BAA-351]EOU24535.1 hypothetical protein I588_00522 [Enterococcus pallens ATCC BAA-351]
MSENIAFTIAMIVLSFLLTMALKSIHDYFKYRVLKKKETKTQNIQRRQPQYTDDEIRTAQYLEQKAELDKRYYVFRQLMHHHATKYHDRRP